MNTSANVYRSRLLWPEAKVLPGVVLFILLGMMEIGCDNKSEDGGVVADDNSAATKPQDNGVITLFDRSGLKNGHIYLEDPGADPASVWQVQDDELWVKGSANGFLRTGEKYSDFKLILQWRWPEEPGNSGVLLRMNDDDKIWPICLEAQLMDSRAGDIVGMGCDFNENTTEAGTYYRFTPCINDSNEKNPGQWNTCEILCQGDVMELKINGLLQNKATGVGVRNGYIGLQCEGSPIVFRNIKLTPTN